MALDGSALTIERRSNTRFYGRKAGVNDIIDGAVTRSSESVRRLLAAVAASTRNPAPPAPASTDPAAPASPAAEAPAAPKTFPLEDNKPGTEPPR